MDVRTLAVIVASLLTVAGCDRSDPAQPAPATVVEPTPATSPAPAAASPSFVNKVWQVAESEQVAAGSLRVFLSDGTLVMADPQSTPALGAWRYDDGRLTIIEESREYPTDILDLTESALRIRMRGPGEPVEMLLAPAGQTSLGAIAAAKPAEVATPFSAEPETVALWGTAWRLEGIAGAAARYFQQVDLVPRSKRLQASGRQLELTREVGRSLDASRRVSGLAAARGRRSRGTPG